MKAVHLNEAEEQIKIGEQSVFDDTFRAYYEPLCYYASKFLLRQDAEDVIENLFIRLWNNNQSFENSFHLKNFLYQAAKNACLDFLKVSKRADKKYHSFSETQSSDQVQKDHLYNMIQSEVLAEIYRALNELPSQCSNVIRMSYLEGYSNKEIAEQLGINEQTVKNYKGKGLDLLKRKLPGHTFGILLLLATWHK